MTPTRPLCRYHGGKWRLAPWIISHFPPHKVYVEPFGGAASVLMRKPRSHGEVYNDLDSTIVNLLAVVRNDVLRGKLVEQLLFTPYSRIEFERAFEHTDDAVENARRTLIRAEMGFGSAGATRGVTGFRIDTRRDYGTAMQVWSRLPEGLAAFGERLRGVLLENRPAELVIKDHDTPETLFYVDPPYVHSTRQMGNRCYRHEMTDIEHMALLELLRGTRGMVVLSGYVGSLYDTELKGWTRIEKRAQASAAGGTVMRTEVLWLSPNISHGGLFEMKPQQQAAGVA